MYGLEAFGISEGRLTIQIWSLIGREARNTLIFRLVHIPLPLSTIVCP
jgi:hypothetical protein